MEHVHKGRIWTEVGREPYRRRDGTMTELVRWQTPCRTCGVPFEIKTPLKFEGTKAFALVNCSAHRMTREEAAAAWNAQIKANKEKKANSECADLC